MTAAVRTQQGRRRSAPLAALRLAFYAAVVFLGVATQASAIRAAARIALHTAYFAPAAPNIPVALGIGAATLGYATWLFGATLWRWRMPMVTHLVPLAVAGYSMLKGPLPLHSDHEPAGPADRTLAAMRVLAGHVQASGCAAPGSELEARLNGDSNVPPTGYRAFGKPLQYRVTVFPGRTEPVREVQPGARPGDLYVTCDADRRAQVTGVVTDALPTGEPMLVRDGVGRVAVFVQGVTP